VARDAFPVLKVALPWFGMLPLANRCVVATADGTQRCRRRVLAVRAKADGCRGAIVVFERTDGGLDGREPGDDAWELLGDAASRCVSDAREPAGALSGPQSILVLERSVRSNSGRGLFQDVSDATRFRKFGRERWLTIS
jgi:hypothetical protein